MQSAETSLFRQEALAARQSQLLGNALVMRPVSFQAAALIAFSIILVSGGALLFASYTQHASITGQLLPDKGIVKVYAPRPGTVTGKSVAEGQAVRKGDLLYLVSTENIGESKVPLQTAVAGLLKTQITTLEGELARSEQARALDHTGAQKAVSDLMAQMNAVNDAVSIQERQVAFAEQSVTRYRSLLEAGAISTEQLDSREVNLLSQRERLLDLKREHVTLSSQLARATEDLRSASLKAMNGISQTRREILVASQELTGGENNRAVAVVATEDGIATAAIANKGEHVDTLQPLVTIIPSASKLVAQLYAPPNTIAFMRPGQKVVLRYRIDGGVGKKYEGEIVSVSRVALAGSEMPAMRIAPQELRYQVTVNIPDQWIETDQQYKLKANMQVDGEVILGKRHLYEFFTRRY